MNIRPLSYLHLWEKSLGDFVIVTTKGDDLSFTKIPSNLVDFNGITLVFGTSEEKQHYWESTPGMRIWRELSQYLNFTIDIMPLSTTELLPSTIIHTVTSKQIDILDGYQFELPAAMEETVSLKSVCYRAFIIADDSPNKWWILKLLNTQSILCTAIIIILLSLAQILIYKCRTTKRFRQKQPLSILDSIIYTYATLTNQDGLFSSSIESLSQVLSITRKLFAWLFVLIVTSNLISLRSSNEPKTYANFETFLKKTDYLLSIDKRSELNGYFTSHVNVKIQPYIDSHRIVPRRTLRNCNRKMAIYEYETWHHGTSYATRCNYYPAHVCDTKVFNFVAVPKNCPYKKTINFWLLKILETASNIITRNASFRFTKSAPREVSQINLGELHVHYGIFFAGVGLSIVILLIEWIVARHKQYQTNERKLFVLKTFQNPDRHKYFKR